MSIQDFQGFPPLRGVASEEFVTLIPPTRIDEPISQLTLPVTDLSYSWLLVRLALTSTRISSHSDAGFIRINDDAGAASYNWYSNSGVFDESDSLIHLGSNTLASAQSYTPINQNSIELTFPFYSNTNLWKTVYIRTFRFYSFQVMGIGMAVYKKTEPIRSLTLWPANGPNWREDGQFEMYGVGKR